MTLFPPPHDGSNAGDAPDGPPAGEPPRKLRLIPLRPVLGDLPVRLSFGRVRRFAPAWAVRFFPRWPSTLARRWWIAVVGAVCAVALVSTVGRAVGTRAHPLDAAVESWAAAPARRVLRGAAAAIDLLDAVPLSIAGAVAFAAFCWRTRRDRLAVAATLAAAAAVVLWLLLQLVLAPIHAALHGRVAADVWLPSAPALAALSVAWTIAVALPRTGVASGPLRAASIGWPIVAGALRVIGGGAFASEVVVGWLAGLVIAICASALWLTDRRRGTRLA